MNWDYNRGDLNKYGITSGGMSKKEESIRELIIKTLTSAGLNAESAYFGVMFYHEGKGYQIKVSEDG